MVDSITRYLQDMAEQIGQGWNRFWFTKRIPHTLCLMRVLVGVIALYIQLTYSWDLVRFFGSDGLLPVSTMEEWRGGAFAFSYFNLLSEPGELWFVHVAGTVILVLFTVGLWSRVTSVLALIVMLSYVNRAPMITSLVEPVVTMLMFYLCLAPSGAYFSVDYWLTSRRGKAAAAYDDPAASRLRPSLAVNIATRLMQVHVAAIYLMMALAKLSGDVWWTGTAMWWIVSKPESRAVDFAGWLSVHPYFVDAWTHAIVLYELAFCVLIWNRFGRPLLLVVGVGVWTLLALATGNIPFCMAMLVGNLCFLAPSLIATAAARRRSESADSEVADEAPAVASAS